MDVLGNKFKNRGFDEENKKTKTYTPKAKCFSREQYVYELSNYEKAAELLNVDILTYNMLRDRNETEQHIETKIISQKVNEGNLDNYIQNKEGLQMDKNKYNILKSIKNEIKIL